MKPGTTPSQFPINREEAAAAIERAPERVEDPECPYDPNAPAAVEAFWKNASVHRPGQPVPGKEAK